MRYSEEIPVSILQARARLDGQTNTKAQWTTRIESSTLGLCGAIKKVGPVNVRLYLWSMTMSLCVNRCPIC